MDYPSMQCHDGQESSRRIGMGCTGCKGPAIPVLVCVRVGLRNMLIATKKIHPSARQSLVTYYVIALMTIAPALSLVLSRYD